jgi:hypothetical protein
VEEISAGSPKTKNNWNKEIFEANSGAEARNSIDVRCAGYESGCERNR